MTTVAPVRPREGRQPTHRVDRRLPERHASLDAFHHHKRRSKDRRIRLAPANVRDPYPCCGQPLQHLSLSQHVGVSENRGPVGLAPEHQVLDVAAGRGIEQDRFIRLTGGRTRNSGDGHVVCSHPFRQPRPQGSCEVFRDGRHGNEVNASTSGPKCSAVVPCRISSSAPASRYSVRRVAQCAAVPAADEESSQCSGRLRLTSISSARRAPCPPVGPRGPSVRGGFGSGRVPPRPTRWQRRGRLRGQRRGSNRRRGH